MSPFVVFTSPVTEVLEAVPVCVDIVTFARIQTRRRRRLTLFGKIFERRLQSNTNTNSDNVLRKSLEASYALVFPN